MEREKTGTEDNRIVGELTFTDAACTLLEKIKFKDDKAIAQAVIIVEDLLEITAALRSENGRLRTQLIDLSDEYDLHLCKK